MDFCWCSLLPSSRCGCFQEKMFASSANGVSFVEKERERNSNNVLQCTQNFHFKNSFVFTKSQIDFSTAQKTLPRQLRGIPLIIKAFSEWTTDKREHKQKFSLTGSHQEISHFGICLCSPDKTDSCSISNPKVNRILNKIAIRTISSFLNFHNKFCTFVYTHTLLLFGAIWSLNFYWFGHFTTKYFFLF